MPVPEDAQVVWTGSKGVTFLRGGGAAIEFLPNDGQTLEDLVAQYNEARGIQDPAPAPELNE